jgi:tRNA G18 (ribose-2'-O)-methylase SpoU
MEELGRATPATFREQTKTPIVVVVDNVRSALNVGSIFRTADAFALEKIYLCGITATPPHREILKTALGSTETVEWEYVENAAELVQNLRQHGFATWAVEQAAGSTSLERFDWQPQQKIAVVFGNEVEGVGEQVIETCDGCLEIPQFGTKHSLNVAVCVGIITWELIKKIKFPLP